jgi:hypothetical protein
MGSLRYGLCGDQKEERLENSLPEKLQELLSNLTRNLKDGSLSVQQDKLTLEERQQIIKDTCQATEKLAATCPTVKFLSDHAFRISLNANDTFGYACAEAVEVAVEDLPKLLEVEKLFGADGVTAFMSVVEKAPVLKELQTEGYLKALEHLKDYRPASWVL